MKGLVKVGVVLDCLLHVCFLIEDISSHLYTPGADCGPMKLFSRSRRTSFSIRTWAGSRSLGSFAGRIISDWKNAARSLREVAADSKAGDIMLLSRDKDEKDTAEWLVAGTSEQKQQKSSEM